MEGTTWEGPFSMQNTCPHIEVWYRWPLRTLPTQQDSVVIFRHNVNNQILGSYLGNHLKANIKWNTITFFFSSIWLFSFYISLTCLVKVEEACTLLIGYLLEARLLLLRHNSKWQDYTPERSQPSGESWPPNIFLHIVVTRTFNEWNGSHLKRCCLAKAKGCVGVHYQGPAEKSESSSAKILFLPSVILPLMLRWQFGASLFRPRMLTRNYQL